MVNNRVPNQLPNTKPANNITGLPKPPAKVQTMQNTIKKPANKIGFDCFNSKK